MSKIVDKIIKTLKESKVTSKRWKGKWCPWFKEEFEDIPEVELLLRTVLEKELTSFKSTKKVIK